MKLLTVDTIDDARAKIIDCVKTSPLKTEIVSLDRALGRILAEDIFAPCDIPSFRRSTVDGYAVVAANTAGAGDAIPVFLKQTGFVLMGKPANFSIKSGECAYVPTGGMLPDGADAVVMAEYCELIAVNAGRLTVNSIELTGNCVNAAGNGEKLAYNSENRAWSGAGDMVAVYEGVAPGIGTVEIGEDAQKGKLLIHRGDRVRAQEMGVLAAAGIINISVFVPRALSIISTGDELAAPEHEPAPGEVRDINTYALKALAVQHGYHVLSAQVLPDDEQRLESTLREVMALSDIVIISGGSSQGEKDFTAQIIDCVAQPGVFTHGLAVKPGKPTILGWDEKSKTLFAGLPGHPVSAMMVFTLLFGNEQVIGDKELVSGIREQAGERGRGFPVPARVSCNVHGAVGKTVCQPVVLTLKDGGYLAEPVFGKSGLITTLTRADGYIIIDMNREGIQKDESVLVHLF